MRVFFPCSSCRGALAFGAVSVKIMLAAGGMLALMHAVELTTWSRYFAVPSWEILALQQRQFGTENTGFCGCGFACMPSASARGGLRALIVDMIDEFLQSTVRTQS